jgi:hypothetical protein
LQGILLRPQALKHMSLLIQAECSRRQPGAWPIAYDAKQFYKSAAHEVLYAAN